MNKNQNLIPLVEVYENYFKDEYSNYDSFFGTIIRHDKIKSIKKAGKRFIDQKDIFDYFDKREEFEKKKLEWLDILDNINMDGKLQQLCDILNTKYQIIYSCIIKDSLGTKIMDQLEAHKEKIAELGDYINEAA